MGSLRAVQKLDEGIREIGKALASFDERLAEVEEPAFALEAELGQVRERLSQMKADQRRLERSAEDKRARAERMDQRLMRVSNLREEAAVKAELDLIRRAIDGDEQEALQLIDQIRRTETHEAELAARATEAREQVGPQQATLLEERNLLRERLGELQARREETLAHVASLERRVYESFHQSGRAVVVAPLTDDGACGNCFGVVPLQQQNEVRQGGGLVRCEACGVILTTEPEPELDPALTAPIPTPRAASDTIAEGEEEGEPAGSEEE